MRRTNRSKLKATCLSALMVVGFSSLASPVSASTETSYVVIEQRLKDFVRELAAHTGARISLTSASRGWIRNTELSGDLPSILTGLESKLELDWFEYNNVYFISKKSEAVTRMVRLGDLKFSDVSDKLESSDFPIDRFPLRSVSGGSALIVTGPPRLLALVEATIESIPKTPGRTGIVIRRGIHIGGEAEDVSTE